MIRLTLPEGVSKDDIVIALYEAARLNADEGYMNISKARSTAATELDDMNPDAADYTAGCVCHCDLRDPTEIACYVRPDELKAMIWALKRITFGDLDDDIDVRHVHSAYKELESVAAERLG